MDMHEGTQAVAIGGVFIESDGRIEVVLSEIELPLV